MSHSQFNLDDWHGVCIGRNKYISENTAIVYDPNKSISDILRETKEMLDIETKLIDRRSKATVWLAENPPIGRYVIMHGVFWFSDEKDAFWFSLRWGDSSDIQS